MNTRRYSKNHWPKLGWKGHVGLVLLAFFIIGCLGFVYAQKNSEPEIRVAQVCALATQTAIPSMDVIVTLYDKDGHQTFTPPLYLMKGNQVELQGNVIAYPTGVTYKLTNLQGHFDDPVLQKSIPPTLIPLNKGEDGAYSFFSKIPTVTASDNSLLLQADGNLYNIYVTAAGFSAVVASGPLACGLNQ